MKLVKTILTIILILIAIPLLIALFIQKEYAIEREIAINKPRLEVFNYVKHLKNQDNYSTWVRMDPNMKKDFRGTDGTVGFVYAWNGNKEAGQGEQEIKNIVEGQRVEVEIRFVRPFEGSAMAPLVTEPISENQTKVKWTFKGKNPYPLNFMNLFMNNLLGKDMETSLSRLKGVLEKS